MKKKWLSIFAAAIFSASLLTACSGDDGEAENQTEDQTEDQAETNTEESAE
ncbi:hypothetical protein [Gracilibacillus xinjiangensis]|uniref:Uncharacterized protein n=1 Tax=Gracilibacillus xinjiangensis TaxID=1193282 RepID=A0ABV8WQL2_9BACI